jgi:hypothetical protein
MKIRKGLYRKEMRDETPSRKRALTVQIGEEDSSSPDHVDGFLADRVKRGNGLGIGFICTLSHDQV